MDGRQLIVQGLTSLLAGLAIGIGGSIILLLIKPPSRGIIDLSTYVGPNLLNYRRLKPAGFQLM